ncbi:2369_t:CDS:2 [Dentiscutata heterogama]|uniref:2369_t:CDS:1 n=1 Tax=Dentiscutata heterogama TaxID=1316150 RepID=A0ACA9MM95_9GLOM|nr:2369_t:CDS:2 [Dentiscutata heterogama]
MTKSYEAVDQTYQLNNQSSQKIKSTGTSIQPTTNDFSPTLMSDDYMNHCIFGNNYLFESTSSSFGLQTPASNGNLSTSEQPLHLYQATTLNDWNNSLVSIDNNNDLTLLISNDNSSTLFPYYMETLSHTDIF